MYKRILVLALIGMMAISLAACGQKPAGNSTTSEPNNSQPVADTSASQTPDGQPEETEPPQEAAPAEGGKTLVVYYSATNHTEAVAGYIANALGADLFEIVPSEPYTSDDLDWTDENSRVSREHDDPALRVMELESSTPDNWADYDTVFIGYPIWWGIAAWPVDNFITANDFTGKTVIPFATSSSSGLGESGSLLEELAGTGTWLDGQRFRSSASEEDVTDWVSGLELAE